jgi:hypothetical protein
MTNIRLPLERFIRVEMDWYDMGRAAQIGCMRNIDSLRRKSKSTNGADETDNWTKHIEGAQGELTPACHYASFPGTHWPGIVGDRTAPDVRIRGTWCNVKTNMSRDRQDLIVKRRDSDEYPYIGVLSYAPVFYITGWLPASEVKQDKWWDDPFGGRPAYFVPVTVLRPMHELLEQEAA